MYYSATTNGFYPVSNYANAPEDLVEITDQDYADLLAGQVAGSRIVSNERGYPVLLAPSVTYQSELAVLNSAFQARVEAFNKQFAIAALSDGPSEESKKLAIRAEYEASKTQNAADRTALKLKYGI